MAIDPTQIPQPVASGSNQPTPSGVPASTNIPPAPVQAASASETPNLSTAVMQDVANKPSNLPTIPGAPASQIPVTVAQPAAAQPAQPQTPHAMHQSLYQRALSILAPPTQYVDAQGNPQQTRPSLSNSILSGAIAGMLTPTAYRQGEVDTQTTAANAFAAGKQQRKEADENVQKQIDDRQTRMLGVAKMNADLLHLHAATMQDQATMGDLVQKQVANDAPSLAIARTHDQNLQGTDTKAILASGLTLADAMANPLYRDALLKHTLLRDGSVDVDGVPTATYSIIDPHVKVSMDAPSVAIAAQIFPSWQTAFDNAGGSLQMKLGQIKAVTDQVNSVEYAEKIFGDAANSKDPLLQKLGISSDVEGKIMSAVRQGTPGAQQARQTLMALENSKAAGGTLADTLNRLINDPDARPGSAYILNALGITANQAQDYIDSVQNERIAAQEIAKKAGTIAAQKAKPITFAVAPSIANDKSETPERRQQAQAVIAENLDFKTKEAAMKAQFAVAKPNPNMMTASMTDGTQVAGTIDELKAVGIDPNKATKLPAADQSKVIIARQLISPDGLLTNTQKDLAAFSPDELTAIGNRWNEFAAGTLGSGDPRYIALRTDARLLSTALMQAHVGSRGSEAIMEHFASLANAGKMDGETLKTAIDTERRYVTEKAMLPKAQGQQPGQVTHSFSLGAWQKANPTGDVNAAKAAAQQAGYKVVQ